MSILIVFSSLKFTFNRFENRNVEHLLLGPVRLTVIVACSGGIKRAETPRTGPVNVRMEREQEKKN